jgi:hypothetical protein
MVAPPTASPIVIKPSVPTIFAGAASSAAPPSLMSPKPSFPEVIKPEEAWNFVHYLRTLKTWHPSPKLTLFETPRKVERSASRLNASVTRYWIWNSSVRF